MAIPRPSRDEIVRRIYDRIRLETQISAPLDSSVIGTVVKVIAAEVDLLWQQVEEVVRQTDITTATGKGLDSFGWLIGVPRRRSRAATTVGLSPSVQFTNLGSSSVTIPTGTRVWKEDNPQIAYFTIADLLLAPGQSGLVHVVAASEGEIYNVDAGRLTKHNVPNVNVAVTNILPILTGSFEESDASYRERLIQEFRRRVFLNPANIIALVRSVPGVRDAWLLDMERGTGTFDVIILPYDLNAGPAVLQEVQAALSSTVPAGISALARLPRLRFLDVTVAIRFSNEAGDRRETIRQNVRSLVAGIVNNLPVEDGSGNGSLFLDRIRSAIVLSDADILGVTVGFGLDGTMLAPDGVVEIGKGERLVVRGLSVT